MYPRFKNKIHHLKPSLALLALAMILFTSLHPAVYANDITSNNIVNLTNESRSAVGLNTLTLNAELSAAAKAKAEDMLKNDYFAHTSPSGLSPWHWMDTAGYQYHYAGENLAINYGSVKSEQAAWMKSPTHRANILNGQYTEMGVAVAEGKIDGENVLITVVMFGQPKVLVPPPATSENPLTVPEVVKGAADVQTAVPLEVQLPTMPIPKSLWNLGDASTLVWAGIFEVILVISALYFFYRDAIEYVALERGVRLILSGDISLGGDPMSFNTKPEQSIIAQRE